VSAPAQRTPWWRDAVVLQIYPRSFADSGGDGVGDLAGIRARLPYIQWLGVDAIWLSPIYRSPMADFGYDVADHCDVDPLFGDLAGFDALLADAHARGLRVLLDWVPNHTSDRHPWFAEARASRTSPRRDWYIWRDGHGDAPPNNWRAAFGGPAWTRDEGTGQWYLHLFLPQQPDLNWANPAVEEAMHGTLRFWLDRGVDGFRMDVVHLIGKDPALPDQAAALGGVDRVGIHHEPGTLPLIRRIRRVLDGYGGDRASVGEVNLLDTRLVGEYHAGGEGLHLAFNFLSLAAGWDAGHWRDLIGRVPDELGAGNWPTWVLSNHDTPRHRTRFGGSEARAHAAAVLLLTLRGTPFLFAGEELGLEDADVPPDRRVDPGGRDGCRAPIPWQAPAGHGWPAEPWLPWPPCAGERSAERLRADPASILNLYRRLLAARRASAALRRGDLGLLEAPDDVLAYRRTLAGEPAAAAVVNFGAARARLPLPGRWRVAVASDGIGEGAIWDGEVAAESAVLLTAT
jgi:alpha-glucosidase